MQIGEKGLKLIKSFEGCRLTAYKCPAGVWTIGYGHTANVKQGMVITQAQADNLLKQDLAIYEKYVNDTKLTLNQNQFDALVSFTYNCGNGSLKTLIKNRTLQQIAEVLTAYNKANGKVLAGLVNRRAKEKELFLTPCEIIVDMDKLPYKVQTTAALNIRSGAGTNFTSIRTVKKGTVLTVWAITTVGNSKWGKNGKEYFCLDYCERV